MSGAGRNDQASARLVGQKLFIVREGVGACRHFRDPILLDPGDRRREKVTDRLAFPFYRIAVPVGVAGWNLVEAGAEFHARSTCQRNHVTIGLSTDIQYDRRRFPAARKSAGGST